MADAQVTTQREDIDIEADIHDFIVHYPPSSHDRRRIHVEAKNGVVTLSGNVKAPSTRRYLLENLPNVDGVTAVNADNFHDDETLRIEVGQAIPAGMQVVVEYGTVILSGTLPQGISEETLAKQIMKIPGVRKVVTAFRT